MPTQEQLDLIEFGRMKFCPDPVEWRAVLIQFGGAEKVESLDERGVIRVLDRLVIAGLRTPSLPLISPDYMATLYRWQAQAGMSDHLFRTICSAVNDYKLLHPNSMEGLQFLRVVGFFERYGFDRGELRRSVMTQKQFALLHVAKRELEIADAEFRQILCNYGGGVVSPCNLDQRGFDRLLVYFEALGFVPSKRKPRPVPQSGFGHRRGMATPAQVELIRGLWHDWNGSDDEAALGRWLEKSYGVSALRFLKQNEAGKAITGLRAMVRRRKGAAA